MDSRHLRKLAKELGITADDRAEIQRILREDDLTAPFPMRGPVSYAKVLLLIDIIQECSLREKTALPIALSCTDPSITNVAASSIKKSCLRRFSAGKDLHERVDHLYSSNDDTIGPFSHKLGIGKQWLGDAHQQDLHLDKDTNICNGLILELYQYLKQIGNHWTIAQQWISRLYPGCTPPPTQTLSTDWKRLQSLRNKHSAIKASKDAFLAAEYKLPQPKTEEDVDDTQVETETSEKKTLPPNNPDKPSTSDIFHQEYDSPIKQKLVQHIRDQDETILKQAEEISDLTHLLNQDQEKLMALKMDYDNILNKNNEVVKDRNVLSYTLKLMETKENSLRAHMTKIISDYNPAKVKKQLHYREQKAKELANSVEIYKQELQEERNKVQELRETVQKEKHKKRNEQKRVYYYKHKVNPLEKMSNDDIKALLKERNALRFEVDHLQAQLDECMEDQCVQTFENGRYVDAVRLVCYDFISRNVGTQHVAPLIRSVVENMMGMKVDRLPKATVVKLMAIEADILARKQAARELLEAENVTLHTDATTKKDRHYYSFQISTNTATYSVGMQETVGSDTATQIEATKELLKDLADLVSPEDIDKDSRPTEYQLLFNIRNTMTDRGPTSKGWVEGLETWRKEVLNENVMPHFKDLSKESIDKLSTINDFYCGKHFILGLADRAKVGLTLWEEDIADYTGPLGMEKLPEFIKWNCQKPSGLRLVRTASELVGPGAKEPHGIPTLYNDFLENSKNYMPQFQHNRFNIVFKASSALYHHRHTLKQLLQKIGSENRLHKAVLADLDSIVTISEVRAMGLLEKHMTTPLSTITSQKEHILDMRHYYDKLQNFLKAMVADPTPIMDGTAVLFMDYPPKKDEIWTSLYQENRTPEEDALVEQLLSILCASFLVALERQLFDFVGGRWHGEVSAGTYEETRSVPRNNDISERDFSGLDRLLRVKNTAKLDFIRGLMIFTHNKTAEALHKMDETRLNLELTSAVKLARKSLAKSKENRAYLKRLRLEGLEEKRRKKEALELNRVKIAQNAVDKISVDGQQKNADGVQALMNKYASTKDKKDALKRQLNFYKTLKIQTIPHNKFYFSSGGKEHTVETLMNNLIFVIGMWNMALNAPSSSTSNPTDQTINMQKIAETRTRINHLKRKLLDEAEDVRVKKAKKSSAKNVVFPGLELIGKTIKHRYEITTKTGRTMRKWYKGEVLRQANTNEMDDASEDDKKLHDEQGHIIFMIHYEDHAHPEAIALQADWESGDVKLEITNSVTVSEDSE